MKKKGKNALWLLIVLLLISAGCMFGADRIQRSNGAVEVSEETIETDLGTLHYKLYRPKTATEGTPAPAVLLLHGYQNDHETCDAYAIELSRRGVVVMALDEYGHGATDIGLFERGYVNIKVGTNFGNDSEADGTYKTIGGTRRYRLLMNFSNLSFFLDKYTKDSEGNTIKDSSCGGVLAYQVLADLPYVDSSRLAVSGHSMGTWSSWSVAAAYSGTPIAPQAIVLQCGELFRKSAYDPSITFNNVLLLQAKYDEFSYFRDYQLMVNDELLKSDLRTEFLGTDADHAAWNTTFGSFADGSARRMQLLNTNHRLTTHHQGGLATALDWFAETIGLPQDIVHNELIFNYKELLVLAAMLSVLMGMFPLMELLLNTPLFASLPQALPEKYTMTKGRKWLGSAVVTMLLAGASFPFMTQLGHALLPVPENIFRMTIGTGFLSWYGLLIIIMIVMILLAKRKARKEHRRYDWYAQGLSSPGRRNQIDFGLFGRSLLLALILCTYVYLFNWLYVKLFDLDLRFVWPFFRPFNSDRAIQFLVYILFFLLFFTLSHSKALGTLRIKASYNKGPVSFLLDWLKTFFVTAGGVVLITLLEYIPFFAGIGPGADLLFGSTFGGPFMSILILFLPQVLFYSLVGTICYRHVGN